MQDIAAELDIIDTRIRQLLDSPIPMCNGQLDFQMVFEKYKDVRRKFPYIASYASDSASKRATTSDAGVGAMYLDELAKSQSFEQYLHKVDHKRNPQHDDLMQCIRTTHMSNAYKKCVLRDLANEAQRYATAKQQKKRALAELASEAKKHREAEEQRKQTIKQMAEDAARLRQQQLKKREDEERALLEAMKDADLKRQDYDLAASDSASSPNQRTTPGNRSPNSQHASPGSARKYNDGKLGSKNHSPQSQRSVKGSPSGQSSGAQALDALSHEADALVKARARKQQEGMDADYDFEADSYKTKKAPGSARKPLYNAFDESRARRVIYAIGRIEDEIRAIYLPRQAFYMTRVEIQQALDTKTPYAQVCQKLLEKEAIMKQSLSAHQEFYQSLDKKTQQCEENGAESARYIEAAAYEMQYLREEAARLENEHTVLQEQVYTLARELARRQKAEKQQKDPIQQGFKKQK